MASVEAGGVALRLGVWRVGAIAPSRLGALEAVASFGGAGLRVIIWGCRARGGLARGNSAWFSAFRKPLAKIFFSSLLTH